jgi:hypothetical protein
MANKLSEMKNALGTAARASKYRVNFSIPSAVPTTSDLTKVDVLCRTSSFPAMTIGQIPVWSQGRKLVIPGDTSYTNLWTLRFYATEDHGIRKDMISWMKSADHFQNNSHSGNVNSILGELSVEQLDSAGNPTARYTFHNVFVQEVGEIELNDETVDAAMEYDVIFSFSDWVVGTDSTNTPASGNASTKNDISL